MKVKYKNYFSVPVIFSIFIVLCLISGWFNRYIKKTYAENFETVDDFTGEKGYGELKQTKDGLYNYRINQKDNSAILIYYNGAMINKETTVIVPEKLDGHLLTRIDELAFSWNEYIQKLVLPDSIIELRKGIVSDCPNIKSIEYCGNTIQVNEAALEGFHGTIYTNKNNDLWKIAQKQEIRVEKIRSE